MAVIEIDRNPGPRTLRQFAGLFLIAFGVLGYVVFRRSGTVEIAAAIWFVAALVGTLGLLRPAAIRLVYVGMIYLAFPIGWVVSHVVLALVLYLVLTPIGLVLRLAGRDPLARGFDREAGSYWTPHREADSMERYFRQF
jgi:hypothetical protein